MCSLPSSFCQSHFLPWPPQNSLESMGAAFPKHDEEDEDMREKEVQMESLICAFETLGKAWPRSPETQCKSADDMQNKLFSIKMKSGRREGPGDHVHSVKSVGRDAGSHCRKLVRVSSEKAALTAFLQNKLIVGKNLYCCLKYTSQKCSKSIDTQDE